MICRMADVTMDIVFHFEGLKNMLLPYACEGDAEVKFCFSKAEVETHIDDLGNGNLKMAELLLMLKAISEYLIEHKNGTLFHASAIDYNGSCILISAPSGTGKSTHARYWKQLFGEKVTYVNDDKPFLREQNCEFFAYGNIWDGKHNLSNNVRSKIKLLLFIERADKNSVETLNAIDCIPFLMSQTIRPTNDEMQNKQFDFLGRFINSVKIFKIRCTNDVSAAQTVFDAVKEYL